MRARGLRRAWWAKESGLTATQRRGDETGGVFPKKGGELFWIRIPKLWRIAADPLADPPCVCCSYNCRAALTRWRHLARDMEVSAVCTAAARAHDPTY